jgi:competence protein ComEC
VEWAINRTHTRLTVLPLSGGHALHWAAPGRDSHWLIDCGDETGVRSTTLPFLRGQGVNQLGCFVLTHGDARHVRGAELVRSNLLIARVLLSPARFRSAAYRQVRAQVEQTPHLLQEVQAGETLPPWTVLHPTETDRFPLADDNALVLRGELRGTRVLLLSDLGRSGQEVLLERANDLKADIVVAGLPAQGEPLADAVLEAVRPRLIILADASYPATARASQRLRQRLRERGLPVFYTSETQAVTLSFHRDGWTAETSTGARASFRLGEWTFKPTAPPAPPRSALEE